MHPDAGAIIGISLAGSVLLVAIIFLCILHLPCCQKEFKPRRRVRNSRQSTSSRPPITNFGLTESSRDIRELSAIDLQNQSQFMEAAGIINPLWHLRYHSCGSLASLHHHHQCQCSISSNTSCHGWHQFHHAGSSLNIAGNQSHSPQAGGSSIHFEYGIPQLQSPYDLPPPYSDTSQPGTSDQNRLSPPPANPPPYSSPKLLNTA